MSREIGFHAVTADAKDTSPSHSSKEIGFAAIEKNLKVAEKEEKSVDSLLQNLHSEHLALDAHQDALLEDIHRIEYISKQISLLEASLEHFQNVSQILHELRDQAQTEMHKNTNEWDLSKIEIILHRISHSIGVLNATSQQISEKSYRLVIGQVHELYAQESKQRDWLKSIDTRARKLYGELSNTSGYLEVLKGFVSNSHDLIRKVNYERQQSKS